MDTYHYVLKSLGVYLSGFGSNGICYSSDGSILAIKSQTS